MYIYRYLRVVKYFLKLFNEKSFNCILSNNIRRQFKEACDYPQCMGSNLRKGLHETAFTDVWIYPISVNVILPVLSSSQLRYNRYTVSNCRRMGYTPSAM